MIGGGDRGEGDGDAAEASSNVARTSACTTPSQQLRHVQGRIRPGSSHNCCRCGCG